MRLERPGLRPERLDSRPERLDLERDNDRAKEDLFPKAKKKEYGDDLVNEMVSMESLVDTIKGLKMKAAPGFDGISNVAIANFPKKCLETVVAIFKTCSNWGHFPRSWKHAKIKMIPKPNRCVKDSGNYRPISLLSCVGTVSYTHLTLPTILLV